MRSVWSSIAWFYVKRIPAVFQCPWVLVMSCIFGPFFLSRPVEVKSPCVSHQHVVPGMRRNSFPGPPTPRGGRDFFFATFCSFI